VGLRLRWSGELLRGPLAPPPIGSKRSYALTWCMPNNDDDDDDE